MVHLKTHLANEIVKLHQKCAGILFFREKSKDDDFRQCTFSKTHTLILNTRALCLTQAAAHARLAFTVFMYFCSMTRWCVNSFALF